MLLARGFAAVWLGITAPQDDGCLLDLQAIRGQLDHTADGVTTVAEPTRVERRLGEAGRLRDGTLVTFETGGCVHYGFSFTYGGIELANESFGSTAARARSLLAATPVQDEAAANVQLLIRALDSPHDTPGAPGQTYLACGDAVCSLLVTRDESDGTVRLTVSYDFPL